MPASAAAGQHLLQTPGPSNVPPEVLAAVARATIDHRGPEFADLTRRVLPQLGEVFQSSGPVVVYPSSGTGAWEAALVNCLPEGAAVLAFETGHFATLWHDMAKRLGFEVTFIPGDWRHGIDPAAVHELLAADRSHRYAAVLAVHNETSTGVCSRIPDIRAAMNEAGHPALLLVDAVSSLASIDFRHDEWGVDVTVSGSQKGLMLPPGLGFNAISAKALQAAQSSGLRRAYWDWRSIIEANATGFFPYTPPTNLLVGLAVALDMLLAEGMPAVFARHEHRANAVRAAVAGWGLETVCADPREASHTVTAVLTPDGVDAARVNQLVLSRYNMALGAGLGKLSGRVFRIGHLGYLSDTVLAGTLAGVQLGLAAAGITVRRGALDEALDVLARR